MRVVLIAGLAVLLWSLTNVPWTLDDYDQAKQAYTSFEMVRQNHWLYQHTPNEGVATKPPLVGWVSAAIFEATRNWEIAWRLPSFVAALALLWLIARAANAADGASAGLFAVSAFGLNLLSARLATFVRTDMPLALVTFLIGLQIWQKIRRAETWSTRDRAILCALLTAAMLIKGPIVYAFILPGLIAYQTMRRRSGAPGGWSGWWPWIFSLAIFLAWVAGGIATQPGFYESVVLKEFAGRFTETFHKPQPIYFYLPHLLQKFAPWSLLSIGLTIVFWRTKTARGERLRPETLWLICWSVGGLVLMSIIPSKRVDRIFPVVPPLCLLLGSQVALATASGELREKVRPWLRASLIFACVFTAGYTAWKIETAHRQNKDALVRFASEVRATAAQQNLRYEVVGAREEGMLLYLRRDHFLAPDDAARAWQTNGVNALVLPNESFSRQKNSFANARQLLLSGESPVVPRYVFIARTAP
ncbi:MAG TPA: glycosyltransferase family 39 protein [Chthoniobacterales bacterium]|jgi:4-amino-4-deoxy-L-arabinose transferase-like glycosyltransferase